MSRSFLFLNALRECSTADNRTSRRQAEVIRQTATFQQKEDDYIKLYRLSYALICVLQNEIEPYLKKGRGLSHQTKILCTLAFLASGSYQKQVGQQAWAYMSQASVSRTIHEVVEALNHPCIVKKYMRFPQNEVERSFLKEKFYSKYQMPGVIGCVDGTLVAMVRPVNNEERYYCRKGYHARNVQIISDADLNILHVDASFGGASHDSHVFCNSEIKDHLENLEEECFLLGDSGYPQRPYLMTPLPDAEENSPGAYYNELHATARNSVERTIGLLKGRFRCLMQHRVLHYDPDTVGKIVIACCVLHNICNRAGLPAPALASEDAFRERSHGVGPQQRAEHDTDNILAAGRNARNTFITRLWSAQ